MQFVNLQRNRKVDQVQVQIVQTQVLQGLVASHSNVLRSMVSVPEFGSHVEVSPAANSSLDGATDAITNLWPIAQDLNGKRTHNSNWINKTIVGTKHRIFWHNPRRAPYKASFFAEFDKGRSTNIDIKDGQYFPAILGFKFRQKIWCLVGRFADSRKKLLLRPRPILC